MKFFFENNEQILKHVHKDFVEVWNRNSELNSHNPN